MLELQKIRKDINWLIEQIKCLMNKSELTTALSATEWSTNHSLAEGNPYNKEAFTWYNGHIYKSLADDNQYPPNNATYWKDLGEGHQLLEEQSDWNATTGRAFIKNKPLITNVNQDNKVIYFYPTLAELGVLTLEEVTETLIATWIQTQGIIIAEDEVPFFKIKLTLTPVYFDPIHRPGPSATWPEGQTFDPKTYYITDYVLIPEEGYWANVYEDAAGTIPFVGDGQYRTPNLGGNPNLICVYTITSLSKISTQYCRS